mmetsp:Transcript_1009/g.1841  ORF Transcript_1009/g.1841 Transcript_1009/m.1841 type:complete len:164 (+) Transcript_1009:117-608(+)|eukprot:CAMPEP_0182466856 /NCGR_PEP_ID=MMETSP1319-20130603/12763_1 /TAXON_ID=172717 /ORGANISM="Bolidomonas pacifica, Strain RCC208" /LENGTH=163 /DNA_ID=CAMNT_0024666895 /DNA_START=115 /DNA_END=606 /DNA_ORIENTATION=-
MSAFTSIAVSFFLFLVLIHAAVSFVPRALSPSFSTSNLCPTFSPCSAPTVTLLRSSNDPTNPSLDEDGYTLYTDPETNSTGRVFEKLVEYPSVFTIKVVGENTPTFTPDMIDLVNEHADVKTKATKINGKWVSVTLGVLVESAEQLYTIYEAVDKDPRVKFKF